MVEADDQLPDWQNFQRATGPRAQGGLVRQVTVVGLAGRTAILGATPSASLNDEFLKTPGGQLCRADDAERNADASHATGFPFYGIYEDYIPSDTERVRHNIKSLSVELYLRISGIA